MNLIAEILSINTVKKLPLIVLGLGATTLSGCQLFSSPAESPPPAVLIPLPNAVPPPASPPPPPPPVQAEPPAKCVLPEEPSPEAAKRAVEQAMQAYAATLQEGTLKAVAAHYTMDGELELPDLATLKGRKAIQDFLTPLESTSQITAVKMRTDKIDVHGPLAAQSGTYDQDAGERGKPTEHFHGRYLAVWRLEADGIWRLSYLMMQPLKADVSR